MTSDASLSNNSTVKDKPTKDNPWVVGFPIYDGFTTLDLIGAVQMFAYCFDENGNQLYFPVLIAPEKKEHKTYKSTARAWPPINPAPSDSSDPNYKDLKYVEFTPHFTFQDVYDGHISIDILFVPGAGAKGFLGVINGTDTVLTTQDGKHLNYLGALKYLASEAKWYGCICTAALILASAGLFQGSRATTHWASIPALKKFEHITVPDGYPRAVIDTDCTGKGCFSGGGISSSSDLALALIQHISGKEAAERSQLINQYGPDPVVHYGDPARGIEHAFAVDSGHQVITVTKNNDLSGVEHYFGPELTLIEQQSIRIFEKGSDPAITSGLNLDGKVRNSE